MTTATLTQTQVIAISDTEIEVITVGSQGPTGPAGPSGDGSGSGLPMGGTTGQVLKKNSGTDFDAVWSDGGGGGTGTVTSVSVSTANGVSGSVATSTSTPAITLTLGAITPSTVNGVTLSGSSTPTLTVTGTTSVSGTNTGDQTSVSGNAGTATALQTARTIGGVSFNGTANITVASATGGFTISGGDLAIGANNITMSGSIGSTGTRLTKGWFTDLQVTNAINGSITGNASTVTTNANLTGDVTSSGNTTTIGAGKVTEAMQVLANNTTNNVSTSKHGYAPILPNDATKYLDGTGNYTTPAGGGGGGSPGGSSGQVQINSSGAFAGVPFSIDSFGHVTSNATGTTTIAANAGAGTSPTISITGNDVCGIINLTTGTSPTAGADIFTISFANAYAAAPKTVLMFPATTAAVQGSNIPFNSAITTGGWTITSRSGVALTASTAYAWRYLVIG